MAAPKKTFDKNKKTCFYKKKKKERRKFLILIQIIYSEEIFMK